MCVCMYIGEMALPHPLLLTNEQGAQTTLIVASAKKGELLVNGAYYTNTCGRMILSDKDIINDQFRSEVYFDTVEKMIAPFLAVE